MSVAAGAEASVTVTVLPEMLAVPVPAMVLTVLSGAVACTENALPAGVEAALRFTSKVTVSSFPSTAALENTGGVLLVTVLALKVATTFFQGPADARSTVAVSSGRV